MAGDISRLVGVYPAVPESIVFAPDDESGFGTLETNFFRGVVIGLGYAGLSSIAGASIRSRELIRENDVPVPGNETNDRLTELRVSERTVATTLKIRTDFNFIQGLFALHITPEMEQQLRLK